MSNSVSASEASSPLLSVREARVIFNQGAPTELVALQNLNLEVAPGDFITIIGSNGAGKSTLMRMISGAVTPVSGSVILCGRDVTNWPDYRRVRWVSHVMQNPLAGTVPDLTLEENLSLAETRGHRRGLRIAVSRKRRSRYTDVLAELEIGLEERLDARAGLLSGGQRQALALLMATLEHPSLLLLDEHTAALDPPNHAMIMRLTDRLVADQHLSVLMVTHNMQAAIDHGSRLMMMHRGSFVLELSGEEKRHTSPEALISQFARLRGGVIDDRLGLSLGDVP